MYKTTKIEICDRTKPIDSKPFAPPPKKSESAWESISSTVSGWFGGGNPVYKLWAKMENRILMVGLDAAGMPSFPNPVPTPSPSTSTYCCTRSSSSIFLLNQHLVPVPVNPTQLQLQGRGSLSPYLVQPTIEKSVFPFFWNSLVFITNLPDER